jgi:hypothetical protein
MGLQEPRCLLLSVLVNYSTHVYSTRVEHCGRLFVMVVAGVVFAQSSYAVSFVLVSVTLLVALYMGFRASMISINLLAAIATMTPSMARGPSP